MARVELLAVQQESLLDPARGRGMCISGLGSCYRSTAVPKNSLIDSGKTQRVNLRNPPTVGRSERRSSNRAAKTCLQPRQRGPDESRSMHASAPVYFQTSFGLRPRALSSVHAYFNGQIMITQCARVNCILRVDAARSVFPESLDASYIVCFPFPCVSHCYFLCFVSPCPLYSISTPWNHLGKWPQFALQTRFTRRRRCV